MAQFVQRIAHQLGRGVAINPDIACEDAIYLAHRTHAEAQQEGCWKTRSSKSTRLQRDTAELQAQSMLKLSKATYESTYSGKKGRKAL